MDGFININALRGHTHINFLYKNIQEIMYALGAGLKITPDIQCI